MTLNGVINKFLIEYDKETVSSSYPSLTTYEIATLLDKASLAFISQKITGANPRKAGFEQDIKAVEDVRPLIKEDTVELIDNSEIALNEVVGAMPSDMLYYIQSTVCEGDPEGEHTDLFGYHKILNVVTLVNHEDSQKFKVTSTNVPWIKNPVLYIEGDELHLLYDLYNSTYVSNRFPSELYVTYIKKPVSFVENVDDLEKDVEFTDEAVELIINLAIVFATETTESQRMQSKSSLLSLES